MLLERRKEYTINEFLDLHKVHYKIDYSKLCRGISITLGIVFYSANVIASPSSGLPMLDGGCLKFLTVAQALLFWGSLFYALKALGLMIIRGEGTWKNILTSIFVCIGAYVIPNSWVLLRDTFK